MKIHNEPLYFKKDAIPLIEEKYKAKYVFETCIKSYDGGWCNFPSMIFYTEEAHPEGSNYFAIYFNMGNKTMITNGISAVEDFQGIQVGDDVIYSRYRHNYNELNEVFVDGGRDYLRYGGPDMEVIKPVKIRVVKDHLEVVDE